MIAGSVTGFRARGNKPAASSERLAIVLDPLRVLLFVLTILTISRVHQHYPMLAKVRPALLLIIGSVVYAFLNPRYLTRENVLTNWPMRLIAVLGILACLSVPFGISLGGSASFLLGSYSKTIAYAFLLAISIRHARDLVTFIWAYVIACAILTYFSLFVFGLSKESASYVARLSELYTYDSNDLGVVLMVGFPLTLLLLTVERGAKRWFLLLNLVGISAAMARSGSRGGFLGFVAVGGAGLLLVNSVSSARRLSILVAALFVLAVGAPSGYWKQMGTIMNPTEGYNYSSVEGRRALAGRAVGYMAQYPVFGLGIGNFGRAECTISAKAINRVSGPMRCSAPHNSYLEAGAELGVVGLIAWAALVMGGIFAPIRLRRRLPQSWRKGTPTERFLYNAATFLSVAMIGFAVSSFFVSFAWLDPVYVLGAFITGLYISARAYIMEAGRLGIRRTAPVASSEITRGWRVRRSAQRFPPIATN
jgi:O-antigen ligase